MTEDERKIAVILAQAQMDKDVADGSKGTEMAQLLASSPDRNAGVIERYLPRSFVEFGNSVKAAQGKPTLFGKVLGAVGLDESGRRGQTSWGDAAKSTMYMPGELVEGLLGSAAHVGQMMRSDGQDFLTSPDEDRRERAAENVGHVFNVAGALPMGGAAIGKAAGAKMVEDNAAGIFGGRLARTADHAKLAQAEEMAGKGVPREQIWNDTGWFQGVDGKWRFEIDDSGATYQGGRRGKLSSIMDHPDLYDAYPEAGRAKVYPRSGSSGGLTEGLTGPIGNRIIPHQIEMGSRTDPRKAFLHESQHIAQAQEGFSRGANLKDPDYWGNLGEQEARAVEKRADLTPGERAKRPPWLDYSPLYSNSKEGALPGLLSQGKDTPQGITAYHGSPHDFDRFSMDKIGTGEGAQAYGHGLYFAENEGVAKQYRDNLTPTRYHADGQVLPDELQTAAYRLNRHGNADDAVRGWLQDTYGETPGSPGIAHEEAAMRRDLAALSGKNISLDKNGHLYEVRINAEPESFLDWDKPLSQQSEKVRGAFEKAVPDRYKGITADEEVLAGDHYRNIFHENDNRVYKTLFRRLMKDEGIPGIKYLDQGSRTAGEGSRNYVVFDEKLIEIIRKYGWAAAAPLLAQMMAQDEPAMPPQN